MGDFHQPEGVPTLHRLKTDNLERMEAELDEFGAQSPLALVLPSLYTELEGDALPLIVRELGGAGYVSEIVVTLGEAAATQFDHARGFFSVLPQRTRVIWNDGPRITDLFARLESSGIRVGGSGKGRAAWMAIGYVLARAESPVIALHDCDIVTYSRELLARLTYPVMSPALDYDFCKGYYMRVTTRMFGRVSRLFVTPLLRALNDLTGHHPLLTFLDGFRYPLAGEFAMKASLARTLRTPSDWGLEMGVLAEVYRKVPRGKACQSELCESYDHKHQELSRNDPRKGLQRMSADIARTVMIDLENEGVTLGDTLLDELIPGYLDSASTELKHYADDAAINGLVFDHRGEEAAIETFAKGLMLAMAGLGGHPVPAGAPVLPPWAAVEERIPGFLGDLMDAIESDNE